MSPQQELEANIRRLRAVHDAAQAVVKVWQEAPYGVSFGSFMERALGQLDAAIQQSPQGSGND